MLRMTCACLWIRNRCGRKVFAYNPWHCLSLEDYRFVWAERTRLSNASLRAVYESEGLLRACWSFTCLCVVRAHVDLSRSSCPRVYYWDSRRVQCRVNLSLGCLYHSVMFCIVRFAVFHCESFEMTCHFLSSHIEVRHAIFVLRCRMDVDSWKFDDSARARRILSLRTQLFWVLYGHASAYSEHFRDSCVDPWVFLLYIWCVHPVGQLRNLGNWPRVWIS